LSRRRDTPSDDLAISVDPADYWNLRSLVALPYLAGADITMDGSTNRFPPKVKRTYATRPCSDWPTASRRAAMYRAQLGVGAVDDLGDAVTLCKRGEPDLDLTWIRGGR
jgi:hypothetical protein